MASGFLFANVMNQPLCVASYPERVVRDVSLRNPKCSAWSRGIELLSPAGDNALRDIVTLLKQQCTPASMASFLQTHGSASSGCRRRRVRKLTRTSARRVNPADALRRTPSTRHGVPVQCAGSTHRLDGRSFARFDPVAPRRQRAREQQQSNSTVTKDDAHRARRGGARARGRRPGGPGDGHRY